MQDWNQFCSSQDWFVPDLNLQYSPLAGSQSCKHSSTPGFPVALERAHTEPSATCLHSDGHGHCLLSNEIAKQEALGSVYTATPCCRNLTKVQCKGQNTSAGFGCADSGVMRRRGRSCGGEGVSPLKRGISAARSDGHVSICYGRKGCWSQWWAH